MSSRPSGRHLARVTAGSGATFTVDDDRGDAALLSRARAQLEYMRERYGRITFPDGSLLAILSLPPRGWRAPTP